MGSSKIPTAESKWAVWEEDQVTGPDRMWDWIASRRSFLRTAGGASCALLLSSLGACARGGGAQGAPDPRPIPGSGFEFGDPPKRFRIFAGAPEAELSTITDFDGAVGRAHVGGPATGINTETGERIPLVLDAEIGFMQGAFVGADGKRHRGTFGFI